MTFLHDAASEPGCPKCNGGGGTPIAWTDLAGRVHHDIAYCDCPAGTARADARDRLTDYSDRGNPYTGERPGWMR